MKSKKPYDKTTYNKAYYRKNRKRILEMNKKNVQEWHELNREKHNAQALESYHRNK